MSRGADIQGWRAEGFFETIRKNPNITNQALAKKFDMAENTCLTMRKFRTVEAWQEAKKAKAERENERRTAAREKAAMAARVPEVTDAEEQVPGQMEMELTPAEKPEMSEQTKMMRVQAAQVDKLYMKLETINDTLNQILRAVRGD